MNDLEKLRLNKKKERAAELRRYLEQFERAINHNIKTKTENRIAPNTDFKLRLTISAKQELDIINYVYDICRNELISLELEKPKKEKKFQKKEQCTSASVLDIADRLEEYDLNMAKPPSMCELKHLMPKHSYAELLSKFNFEDNTPLEMITDVYKQQIIEIKGMGPKRTEKLKYTIADAFGFYLKI